MIKSIRKPDFAYLGGSLFVFFAAFIVYAMTVQRTFSFWDCGEFVACSVCLGVPHPPGSPLFVILGRVFSLIPFVHDIAHRINYISVISSSFTALFSYLMTVELARMVYKPEGGWQKYIIYMGGVVGGLLVAYSFTNWSNSVEAEVYGLSLAFMVLIAWLSVKYYQVRHTPRGIQLMALTIFLALLGVGLHLSVYLVFPFLAMYFILKPEAGERELGLISLFIMIELALILVFADGRGGIKAYYIVSGLMLFGLIWMLRNQIRWVIAIALGGMSSMIIGFGVFFVVAPISLALIIILTFLSRGKQWHVSARSALTILLLGLVGFSIHVYLPVRAAQNPRINENNPSRSFQAFLDFLERKQYGQQSMVDRMFERRGELKHQFGRHANMGFWGYFETQYSREGVRFLPFFALGLIGLIVAINKRSELGLPFLTLFFICSVGLILYMNFADGTLYDPSTGDAHMEVRDRDYFFTPAFVFFGIAIGMGVAFIGRYLADLRGGEFKGLVGAVTTLAIFMVWPALANNYYLNDRSNNYLPLMSAQNMLDNCEENAILFTVGDNETFPLWAAHEVYGFRDDVRVVNTALLQGDWYIEQMKNIYHVPMSLTDEQIWTYPTELAPGIVVNRPRKPFNDRPRREQSYLFPYRVGDRIVDVPEMVVDEIVIENQWKAPIYFTSMPPGNSPLNLRARLQEEGIHNRLMQDPQAGPNTERTWDLFMNKFTYQSLNDPRVTRNIGVNRDFMITIGVPTITLFQTLINQGDTARAIELAKKMIEVSPENWQFSNALATLTRYRGDAAKASAILRASREKLAEFAHYDPVNIYYQQDLGMIDVELGITESKPELIESGLAQMRQAYARKPNDMSMFRKLVSTYERLRQTDKIREVVDMYARYKRNLSDPIVRQYLGRR